MFVLLYSTDWIWSLSRCREEVQCFIKPLDLQSLPVTHPSVSAHMILLILRDAFAFPVLLMCAVIAEKQLRIPKLKELPVSYLTDLSIIIIPYKATLMWKIN